MPENTDIVHDDQQKTIHFAYLYGNIGTYAAG